MISNNAARGARLSWARAKDISTCLANAGLSCSVSNARSFYAGLKPDMKKNLRFWSELHDADGRSGAARTIISLWNEAHPIKASFSTESHVKSNGQLKHTPLIVRQKRGDVLGNGSLPHDEKRSQAEVDYSPPYEQIETTFRRLVLDIGLLRSRVLIEDVVKTL